MSVENTTDFRVTYNAELQVAEVTWRSCPDSYSFRDGYEQLAAIMLRNSVHCALIDIRCRTRASHAEQLWLSRYFFPIILQADSSTVKLAFVIDEAHYTELQGELPEYAMESFSQLLKIHVFTNEHVARGWLING